MLVSSIRPVIDSGWMMVIGLGVAFLLSFTMLPAVLLLKPGTPARRRDITGAITAVLAWCITTAPRATLALSAALAVIGLAGALQLSIENRFIDKFRTGTEINLRMRLIDEKLGGTTPLDVLIDAPPPEPDEAFDDADELDKLGFLDEPKSDADIASTSYWLNRTHLPELQLIHEYLESLPGTGKVLSVATAMSKFAALEPRVVNDDFYLLVLYRRLPDAVKSALFHPYLLEDGQ